MLPFTGSLDWACVLKEEWERGRGDPSPTRLRERSSLKRNCINGTSKPFALAVLVACLTVFLTPRSSLGAAECPGTVSFGNSLTSAITNLLTMSRIPVGKKFLAALYCLPDTGGIPT